MSQSLKIVPSVDMVVAKDIQRSAEGYQYDVNRDMIISGLPTLAVRASSENTTTSYDAIVIGAGFAGLVAARDLSLAGKRVLLLEARDRIGGRTWTFQDDNHRYEMGGTWVHWLQPHIWAEITRYGLTDQVKVSSGMSDEADVSYYNDNGTEIIKERPESTDERLLPLIAKLLDTDGNSSRTLFPMPCRPLENAHLWSKWDISLEERSNQLQISEEDRRFLLGWFVINTCAPPDKSSFLNLIRLLSLSAYDFNTFMEICGKFKFKDGTTSLALAILGDYNGDTLFSHVVKSVVSEPNSVKVRADGGKLFSARQVICTIPLHCLADVDFSPPLPTVFKETKHANFAGKVHVHSAVPVKPWFGISTSDHSVCATFTESDSAQGGTHLVSFATGNGLVAKHHIKDDPKAYIRALRNDTLPVCVRLQPTHLAWHDWTRDKFSKGGWASYGPGQLKGPLAEIMKRDHVSHNVILASADWASGWVGYIDGALEMGRRAAKEVSEKLDANVRKHEATSKSRLQERL